MKKYYLMLITTIVVWGVDPVINRYLYNYYSAAALASLGTFFSMILFIILASKNFKMLDKRFFKIALPIAFISALANVSQRIGLQYTTPACYSFLERLCCVVVPIMAFILTKKKPTILQALASIICLSGCFILSGVNFSDLGSIGIGNILCALAGILAGIYITMLSVYGKDINLMLYMALYMVIYFLQSLALAIVLNFIKVGGVPMEKFVFCLNPKVLVFAIVFSLFSIALCWLLRTEATAHLNPAKTVILTPLSSIIAGVVSVVAGYDKFSSEFACGAIFICVAVILYEAGDVKQSIEAGK